MAYNVSDIEDEFQGIIENVDVFRPSEKADQAEESWESLNHDSEKDNAIRDYNAQTFVTEIKE